MIREQFCIYWDGLPSTLVDGLPNEKTGLLLSRGGLLIRKYDGFSTVEDETHHIIWFDGI